MKTEIWKDIPGYEGRYQASSFGRIKSLERVVPSRTGGRTVAERILKQHIKDKCGHLAVSLGKGSQGIDVHRIIALTFIGKIPPGKEILHTNGIPTDNRPSNLRFGTRSENILDTYRYRGFWKRLTIQDVYEIRTKIASGVRGVDIAQDCGISTATVSDIKHGRRYGWLK